MAWRRLFGGARGAGGNRDPLDSREQPVAIDALEAHVEISRKASFRIPVAHDPGQLARETPPQAITEVTLALGLGRTLRCTEIESGGRPDQGRHRQCPRAQPPFVPPAELDGCDPNVRAPGPNVERANPFRTVKLVERNREQIDIRLVHVDGELAHGLGGVGVQPGPSLAATSTDFRDGLNHPDLIVGPHDRDEEGPLVNRPGNLVGIHPPAPVHPQSRHPHPLGLEKITGIEDRLVLGGNSHDVIALGSSAPGESARRADGADQGQVVALGGATGKHDVVLAGSELGRNPLARIVHGGARPPAVDMGSTGRVSEVLAQIGLHGLQDPGVQGRRRLVVEIDRAPGGHARLVGGFRLRRIVRSRSCCWRWGSRS